MCGVEEMACIVYLAILDHKASKKHALKRHALCHQPACCALYYLTHHLQEEYSLLLSVVSDKADTKRCRQQDLGESCSDAQGSIVWARE